MSIASFVRFIIAPMIFATAVPTTAQTTYWGSETAEAKQLVQQYAAKQGTMGRAPHAMIAACHNRSVEIGLAILKRGGNAVDAFIAVTFADYVQTPGASSLGGPMGALVYDAKSGAVDHVGAPLKTARDPAAQWTAGASAKGMQVLIPGAVAGLELMHRKRGKLPWRELVAPAQRLAQEGFPVDYMYGAILANYVANVSQSEYGRATFLRGGAPLKAGDTLKLPVLAATLANIGKHGARYMHRGEWSGEAVREIAAQGGKITADDFAGYAATWTPALRVDYRGALIYGPAVHDSGGARLALALEVLEHTDIRKLGHYSESLDGLETLMRVVGAVNTVPMLATHAFFENPDDVQALVDGDMHAALWKDVQEKVDHMGPPPAGSHSYSVVVVDAAGNAVAGTHTIESLPFGSGIFVGGVPLNNTGVLHPYAAGNAYATPPGSYLVEPLSATLAFRNKQLVLASSTFSAALWPGDLQLVVSALDFDWTPERIALTPRFGGYALDLAKMAADTSTMTLDKRFTAATVTALQQRGRKVSQAGYVDTGMLVMVKRDPATGELSGFTPEQLPDGKAAGF
jgi:gamma-glutamyltranspeptidase/glutathione hydrolase